MTELQVHENVPSSAPVWAEEDGKHTYLRHFGGNAVDVAVSGIGEISLYEWRGEAGWLLLPRGAELAASTAPYRLVVGRRESGSIAVRYFAAVGSQTARVWAESMTY